MVKMFFKVLNCTCQMDSNGKNSCLEGNFGIKKLQSKSQPTNLNTTDKEYLPHSSDDERVRGLLYQLVLQF